MLNEPLIQDTSGSRWIAFGYFLAAVTVAVADYNLTRILSKSPRLVQTLNKAAGDARWWLAVGMLSLFMISISPFIEQPHWPFTSWVTWFNGQEAQKATLYSWLLQAQQERDKAQRALDDAKRQAKAPASPSKTTAPHDTVVTDVSHGSLVGTARFLFDGTSTSLKQVDHNGIGTVTITTANYRGLLLPLGESGFTVRFLFSDAHGPYIITSSGDSGLGYTTIENTKDFVELYLRNISTLGITGQWGPQSGIIEFSFYEKK